VRHARPDDLGGVEELLAGLRAPEGLTERSPGTFYRGSKAFLHFHADPAGLFADVKLDAEFERFRATTKAEQRKVLAVARRALGGAS
jgi:N-acetylglutamate synthase-like GNAT family acetyltransferase